MVSQVKTQSWIGTMRHQREARMYVDHLGAGPAFSVWYTEKGMVQEFDVLKEALLHDVE